MRYGGIAQLGEHLLCKQGVSGSIPLISTKSPRATMKNEKWKMENEGRDTHTRKEVFD